MMGEVSMYKLPAIVNHGQKMDLPTNMYSMPQIQGQIMKCNAAGDGNVDLENVEMRQSALLQRLGDLEQKVNKTKSSLGMNNDTSSTGSTGSTSVKTPISLVIKANPDYPPYGLQCLFNEIASISGISCQFSYHSHSSLKEPLKESLKDFLPDSNCSENQTQVGLKVTLIWKNGSRDPESVFGLNTVKGEANIGRFLARNLAGIEESYPENNPVESAQIDQILDESYSVLLWGQIEAEKQDFVNQKLVKLLAKNKGTLGSSGGNLGLADFLVYSNLLNSGIKVTQNKVNDWMKSISKKNNTVSVTATNNNTGNSSVGTQKLFDFLDKHRIPFETIQHPEVFTVNEMMCHLKEARGIVTKNLFLKDRKKNFYLLSAKHDREINLSDISKKIGVKELRFGDEGVMFETLGVTQGCVTAFALLNDPGCQVNFLVDEALVNCDPKEKVHFHPLVNSATSAISSENLVKFVQLTGHSLKTV